MIPNEVGALITKPGTKSWEFIATLMAQLAALLTGLTGVVEPGTALGVSVTSAALYGISRGISKWSAMGVKPSPKTTEFWVFALTGLGTLGTALGEKVNPDTAMIIGALTAGAFAVSRGLAKKQPEAVPHYANEVAAFEYGAGPTGYVGDFRDEAAHDVGDDLS